MKQLRLIWLLPLLILLLAPATGFAEPPKKQRNATKECSMCHLRWVADFDAEDKRNYLLDFTEDKVVATEMMCYSCHDGSIMDSRLRVWETSRHKEGTDPSSKITIPETFPLNEQGQLTCATCHSAHGVDSTTDMGSTIFLRVPNRNSSMCRQCHSDKDDGVAAGKHPVDVPFDKFPQKILDFGGKAGKDKTGKKKTVICESCHNPHGSTNDHFLVIPNSQEGVTHSTLCETCHGVSPDIKSSDELRRFSHPVAVDIIKEAKLPEKWDNGEEPRLADGKFINCRTCHSPHNGTKENHLLVSSNKQGKLCLTCHTSKKKLLNTKHDLSTSFPDEKNSAGQSAAETGPCFSCHFMHKGKGPKMWARDLNGETIEDLCKSCHDKEKVAMHALTGERSHPVEVAPSKDIEIGKMPLYNKTGEKSADGNVTCASCHDPHAWSALSDDRGGKDVEGDGTNSFLRRAAAPAGNLCQSCHADKKRITKTKHDLNISAPDEKNAKQQTPRESGVCGACHTPHNAKADKLWIRPVGEGEDYVERLCTSCHAKEGIAADKTTGKETHPVGVKPKESGNLPLFAVDGKKSAQGNVSCGTCHDAHRWSATGNDRGGLKVEGDGNNSFLRKPSSPESELCRTCHVEKSTILGSKHDMHVTFPKSRNNQSQTVEQAGVCGICHVPHNADGKRLWAMRPRGTEDLYEAMCLSCHAKGGMAEKKTTGPITHPLGKQPNMQPQFKGKLPLFDKKGERDDEAGTVSCPTCHNAHQWNPLLTEGRASRGKGLEGDRSNSFLRVPYDENAALCSACHKENALVIDTDHDLRITAPGSVNLSHETVADAGVCSACHLVHNAWGNRLWARGVGAGSNRNQALCTGCHARRKAAGRKVIGEPSHPMKRVADARPTLRKEARKFYRKKRKDKAKQKEVVTLPLFMQDGERSMDGDVTCSTCHNVHRWNPERMERGPGKKMEGNAGNSFLRKSNLDGPKLCVTCHASKGYVVGTDHDLSITNPDAKNGLKKTVAESGVCSACHVPHGAKGEGYLLWAREEGEGSNLHQERICLSCHEVGGAGAKKIVEDFTHPQAVKVPQLFRPGSSKYAPVYNEDGYKVNAGLIACPTCHNPHQWSSRRKGAGPGKAVEGNNRNSFLRFTSSGNICRNCHGIDSLQRYKYFHMDDIRTSDKATRGKPPPGSVARKQAEEKAKSSETGQPAVLEREERKRRPSMSERRRALMERRHQKEMGGGL